jgi:hypothetical protein
MVIDQAVAQYRFIEASSNTDRAMEATRSCIGEFVDDYCGTRPPRWPWPWPWPPVGDPAQLRFIDLLMAGAQFQKAADSMMENPLQADFSDAADKLIEAGLRRMEGD